MANRTLSTAEAQLPPRRSATLPVKLQSTPDRKSTTSSRADPGVETLYIHPTAKVISFSTSSASIRPSTSNGRSIPVEETPGTLPWNTRIERTLAVGPLKVYRAPGSVAFINCGNALQPILPKSQCWCVDDTKSKFVLQIHRPQYWRIELPHTEADDSRRLEEFRAVLARILQYEKTPCPFRRNFTVQLPEPPTEPIRYRPWKPVTKPIDEKPQTNTTRETIAKPPLLPTEVDSAEEYYSAQSEEEIENVPGVVEDEYSDTTDDTNFTPTHLSPDSFFGPALDLPKYRPRHDALKTVGHLTAPPKLTLISSPPSMHGKKSTTGRQSIGSSIYDAVNVLPPSPPESTTVSPERRRKSAIDRDISPWGLPSTPTVQSFEMTASDSTSETAGLSTPPTGKQNADLLYPSTPDNRQITRGRSRTDAGSRGRKYSPLPSPVNIYSPSKNKPRRLQTKAHIPTAIVQKTCEILLSPPSYLIHLMVNIASRITAGQWRGMMLGYGEGGEKIVGQWDYSDGDYVDPWDEDDYGVSLAGPASARRQPMPGGCDSWDSD